MQISQTKTAYTPNFQRKISLPSKDVIECITATYKRDDSKDMNAKLKILGKVFKLKQDFIEKIPKIPMAYDLYTISAGKIIAEKNPSLKIIAENIKILPKDARQVKINEVINELGEKINVIL